jgi:RNA polymerase sigma-70 factor, ECF subfamily
MAMRSEHLELAWNEYSHRLLGFIKGKVSDPEEAEDILQEVFIRVHTGLCCLQEWTAMEKWIYRVARNLIIDHYRARKRHEELGDDIEAAGGLDELEADPLAQLAFSLKDTIAELPEPYREALVLTEYRGLSQAEYAKKAGISLSGAKSRVQRARGKLKELLLGCCHFELDRLGGIIDYHERCCRCNPVSCSPQKGKSPERQG